MKQKALKSVMIKTPFGVWEITEMDKMGTLKFLSLKSGEKLIIQSDNAFRSVPIGDLVAWAKIHNHTFPTLTQMEFIEYFYNNGLKEWLEDNNINFAYELTNHITNEALTITMHNPYGNDFIFTKYVCYSTYTNKVNVLDKENRARYMLIKHEW